MTEPTVATAKAALSDEPAVLLHRHEGWAEIVLNRPARRNAIDGALAEGLFAALQAVEADDSIRATVLRGAGGALCSGLDLTAFAAVPQPEWVPGFKDRWREVHVALASTRKVLLVGLERFAINGGAALALAGDILICGETGYLQIAEIRIGMAAPNNLAWLALRHSEAVAARLALLGDRVAGPQLQAIGVATEVVADDQVVARCTELAALIATWKPEGVAAIKGTMRRVSLGMSAAQWFASFQEKP
jgi:enoyl-CoA hydratase/carnithine racemase